nr:protein-L-isoaspartate(D-aspartate) O-methyltransferase [Seculamonas ecuadoriensis]
MAWRSSGDSNAELVRNLKRHHLFTSPRVEAAMLAVDRRHFCAVDETAYEDAPQPIGYNATISAPHMHAMCLEAMEPYLQPGARCLDIGSGSGYLVAAMAMMVGDTGRVFGIEHIPELVRFSAKNLQTHYPDLVESGRVSVAVGDGRTGLPSEGPFDVIHVGAASAEYPEALVDQLKTPGILIVPYGKWDQMLLQVTKDERGKIHEKDLCGVRYVPLTDKSKQLGENFF